jgi:hypothetical protein
MPRDANMRAVCSGVPYFDAALADAPACAGLDISSPIGNDTITSAVVIAINILDICMYLSFGLMGAWLFVYRTRRHDVQGDNDCVDGNQTAKLRKHRRDFGATTRHSNRAIYVVVFSMNKISKKIVAAFCSHIHQFELTHSSI